MCMAAGPATVIAFTEVLKVAAGYPQTPSPLQLGLLALLAVASGSLSWQLRTSGVADLKKTDFQDVSDRMSVTECQ
jgi:hypothetical protein